MKSMEQLRTLAKTLGPVRLAVLGGVGVALAAFFIWITTQVSTSQQALLYGDLDPSDAARIVSQLDTTGVPYTLGNNGTSIFIPAELVARTRLTLAGQGIPSGGSVGYEIFDTSSPLGTTSFQQNVNLVRALEGELARTIREIDGVRGARVHLVLPKRDLFSRDKPEPSASVLLQMRGRQRLSPDQVLAVQHLIASAVAGLTPEHVSIIDGQGTLLSDANGGSDDVAAANARADSRRRELEEHLSRTIEKLVERTVGPGKVRAEVSADMDFDRINTSEEIFDPDGQVVRSTQTSSQSSKNSEGTTPPVSVTTNLPDATGKSDSSSGNASEDTHDDETINYEISKKVINHVRETGIVKRLSVAVLVDGVYTTVNGNRTYQPRSKEEMDKITNLVRTAVGYNADRKDNVEVVSMRFADPDFPVEDEPENFLGLEKRELVRIGEYFALMIMALLVLLLVVKPIVSRTIDALPTPQPVPSTPELLPSQAATPALSGPDAQMLVAQNPSAGDEHSSEEMIDLDRIEGRVKASSLRRVSEIVDKHPEESLAILRNWLHSGD